MLIVPLTNVETAAVAHAGADVGGAVTIAVTDDVGGVSVGTTLATGKVISTSCVEAIAG